MCKVLDKVLGRNLEPELFVYVDDIIITTNSSERHLELLEQTRLKDENLSISSEKSKFCVN